MKGAFVLYGEHHQPRKDRALHTLTIRISPALHQSIEQRACDHGESVSVVVRNLIRRALASDVDALTVR
ncbi:MAG: hypothetical protein ABMA15_10440 [Vicinamibacterales bacterium]